MAEPAWRSLHGGAPWRSSLQRPILSTQLVPACCALACIHPGRATPMLSARLYPYSCTPVWPATSGRAAAARRSFLPAQSTRANESCKRYRRCRAARALCSLEGCASVGTRCASTCNAQWRCQGHTQRQCKAAAHVSTLAACAHHPSPGGRRMAKSSQTGHVRVRHETTHAGHSSACSTLACAILTRELQKRTLRSAGTAMADAEDQGPKEQPQEHEEAEAAEGDEYEDEGEDGLGGEDDDVSPGAAAVAGSNERTPWAAERSPGPWPAHRQPREPCPCFRSWRP